MRFYTGDELGLLKGKSFVFPFRVISSSAPLIPPCPLLAVHIRRMTRQEQVKKAETEAESDSPKQPKARSKTETADNGDLVVDVRLWNSPSRASAVQRLAWAQGLEEDPGPRRGILSAHANGALEHHQIQDGSIVRTWQPPSEGTTAWTKDTRYTCLEQVAEG